MARESVKMDQQEELPGELLAEWLEAAESGHQPDLDGFAARHPQLSTHLQRFVANVQKVGAWTSGLRESLSASQLDPHAAGGPGLDHFPRLAGLGTSLRQPEIPDYQILGVLGWGGMGIVYKARQLSLDRFVALKVLKSDNPGPSRDADRLRMEASLLAHLDHPHIVPIYEVGEYAGHPFFSMRLLDEGKLEDRLALYREQPVAAVKLLATAARAVHHAHQRGILHRDLKPSNILLDDQGQPQVTDFGLARLLETDSTLTQSGALIGTPAYMAPEQTQAGEASVSTATDVYALGAVLYAMLTQGPPFRGATVLDTLLQVREQTPRAPSQVNPRVNRDLDTICLKCLEKKPSDRYGSAESLADDLERWLAGLPIQARQTGLWERAIKWARRRPAIAGLGTAAVTCALLLFCGAVYHYESTLVHSSEVEGLAEEKSQQARLADARAIEARQHAYASQIQLASLKPVDEYPGQMAELLASVKPRPGEQDLRGFEWHWLWRQAQNHRRFRAQSLNLSVACGSPDDRFILAGGARQIEVHDANTLDLVRILPSTIQLVDALRFTANGKWLIACGLFSENHSYRMEIWEWESGKLHYRAETEPGGVFISVTADDRQVLQVQKTGNSDARRLVLHDIETGEDTPLAWTTNPALIQARLAPDDKTIAIVTGQDSEFCIVSVHEFASGRLIFSTRAETIRTDLLMFNSTANLLAIADSPGQLQWWNVRKGLLLHTTKLPGTNLGGFAWSPDRSSFLTLTRTLPGSGATHLSFWRTDNLSRPVRTIDWDSSYGRIELLSAKLGYVMSRNGMLHIWNPELAYHSRSLKSDLKETWFVQFAPDGKQIFAGGDGGSWFSWSPSSEQPVASARLGSLSSCLAVTRDGKLAAVGCFDQSIRLCHLPALTPFKQFDCGSRPRALDFSPDQRRLATVDNDGRLRIWSVNDLTMQFDIAAHDMRPHGLAYSHNGRWLATAGDDNRLKLWNAETLQLQFETILPQASVVAFSPRDEFLAVGGAGGLMLWIDPRTGTEIQFLKGHTDTVRALAFSPDGRTLASGGQDNSVRLWQVPTGKELLTMPGTKADVTGLAFSLDSRSLAISRHDGTVELWPPAEGEKLDLDTRRTNP